MPWSLFIVLFLPILYIIKVFFSSSFGKRKLKTLFIKELNKELKGSGFQEGREVEGKGPFILGRFLCGQNCALINRYLSLGPGRLVKKTKESRRSLRASGKEVLVYACWNQFGQVFV